jgi:hypothetical protein
MHNLFHWIFQCLSTRAQLLWTNPLVLTICCCRKLCLTLDSNKYQGSFHRYQQLLRNLLMLLYAFNFSKRLYLFLNRHTCHCNQIRQFLKKTQLLHSSSCILIGINPNGKVWLSIDRFLDLFYLNIRWIFGLTL